MKRTVKSSFGRVLVCGVAVAAMLMQAAEIAAQKTSSDKSAKTKVAQQNGSKPERSRYRRLPAYFNEVVTPDQREKIYALQEQYAEKIKKLQDEMYALQAKREEEIDAVLSADQRQRVMELAARAKANRKSEKPSAETDSSAAEGGSQP